MLKLADFPEREFTGKAALEAAPAANKLIAITLEGRRAARAGADILDADGEKIGIVTSGAFAPSLGAAVAMGYVGAGETLELGDKVQLSAGRATIAGKITELPFYKDGSVRKKM
jgi:aminomethyltransferase